SNALLIAGALVALGSLLAIPFPLNRARGHDFTPAGRPSPTPDARPGAGPVEVVIDYAVDRSRAAEFLRLMHHDLRPQRLRNGAARWRLTHEEHPENSADPVRYHETFAFV